VRKAEEELDAELNAQRIELRRQYLAAGSALARVDALAKAVRSSEIALEGTRFGLRAGLRTNLDVLDATRQLFQARRDLQQARYGWLLALLQLRAVAGEPLDDIVADLDRMLQAAR
jgi:outer membrane protein TolC